MKNEIRQAIVGANQIRLERLHGGRTGRGRVDVAQRDPPEDSALNSKSKFQILPGRQLDGNSVHDRSQNRSMKHDQQQEESGQSNEEPASPTSAAVRLDSALPIIAHEIVNLFPALVIATDLLPALASWSRGR